MKRKLTAKIQMLNPIEEGLSHFLAKSIVIEPETRNMALKKGTIYAVYSVQSETEFDTKLISNVVHDILHDVYFETESVSPVQSLEKAVSEVKDKIGQIRSRENEEAVQGADFDIIATVLWGSVLYTVQYGAGKGYIMRAGEIDPLKTISEGNFSAGSEVVKDEDVVILSTEDFNDQYPPQKLLASSIADQSLGPSQSAVLLKFIVDTSFSEDETVDFGIENAPKKNKIKKTLGDVKGTLKGKLALLKIKTAKTAGTETTDTIISSETARKMKLRFEKKMLFPIILVAFAAISLSAYFLVIKGSDSDKPTLDQEQLLGADAENGNEQKEEEPQYEEAFYDLKITDTNANPTEIVVTNEYVIVTEKEGGRIYFSSTDVPKFELKDQQFPGITSVKDSGGLISFADKEGYKYYDLEKSTTTETYSAEELNISDTYLDFIYSLKNGSIYKYTKSETSLTESIWGTSDDFTGAKAMAISYSIFVLTKNDTLVKYTSGEKDTFSIKDLETELTNTIRIIASPDFDNMYIADKGNQRVVMVDKNGDFKEEFVSKKEGSWKDMIDIAVSPDEKTLYVLSGTRVYKVDMEQPLDKVEEQETTD